MYLWERYNQMHLWEMYNQMHLWEMYNQIHCLEYLKMKGLKGAIIGTYITSIFYKMSELNKPMSASTSSNSPFIQVKPDILINQNYITWIQRIDECMHICTKVDGCTLNTAHKVCNSVNPTGYEKIHMLFPSKYA